MKYVKPIVYIFISAVVSILFVTCMDNKTERESGSIDFEDHLGFIDFGFMLSPEHYQGRVFKLSQNFPAREPVMDDGVKKILSIDFKNNWEEYALAVRDYIFEGNIDPNGGEYENAFFLEDNKIRKWYHVPWQHWGETGREGFHGLTQEGPIDNHMLSSTQISISHAYAVGFYNDLGGYTIGKLWPNKSKPDFEYFSNGGGFPVGTVVGKLLWTTIDGNEVPYLINPLEWNAYVYSYDVPGSKIIDSTLRTHAKVNLIQMDIMVRDERAINTGGWVFGTFVYNGELENENKWNNLIPVGLMWGNDPEEKESMNNPHPKKTLTNPNLKETIVNASEELPPMHLGWGFRLNGPVDNPNSSCMSCHSTSQYPVMSAIMPFLNIPKVAIPPTGTEADQEWMSWFRNIRCATPFNPGQAVSLDYSLQLSKSVQNYIEYIASIEKGHYAVEYWTKGYKITRNVFSK